MRILKGNNINETLGALSAGWIAIWTAIGLMMVVSCSSVGGSIPVAENESKLTPEEKWGVAPVSIRLTGADHFIDFRYKIVDADKAMKILGKNEDAYLIDEESGKVLPVPLTKLGPMRATKYKPKEDKVYVILFQNVNKMIQRGSQVTVAIGEFRAKDLVVE